jgi:hypothetical protein
VEKLSASLGRFRAVKIRLIIIFVMENPAYHAGGRGFAARQSRWESRDNQDENAPLLG